MDNWNKRGMSPRTMSEWKSLIDSMSKHERNRYWPGMHKDLIPATEMIEAEWASLEQASSIPQTSGSSIAMVPSPDPSQTRGFYEAEDERISEDEVRAIAALAASELQEASGYFASLATQQDQGTADPDELVRLRQLGINESGKIRRLASRCKKAASALRGRIRITFVEVINSSHDNAAARVGGPDLHIARKFDKLANERQVSVLGHEGVHLSGIRTHTGPEGAEIVEAAVFGEHSRPYQRPD